MTKPPHNIEDIARQWVDLWQDYTTALGADPPMAEHLRRWATLFPAGGLIHDARSPTGTPPATSVSVGSGAELDELRTRVAALERRLAALERATGDAPPKPRRSRKRTSV